MDPLTISAASGLRARIESLEMLANNISNASTAGYKADREFYGLYASAEAQSAGAFAELPVIESNWIDFSQGTLTPTGGALDLALSGRGFFVAVSPSGPVYTRAGNFRLSPQGVLVTQEGYPLRTADGKTIQAGPGGPLEFQRDGEVRQDGRPLGRLELADFDQPQRLDKHGHNYFRLAGQGAPRAAGGVEVHQGKLESSNAHPGETAVRLVNVMRQFEMLQRAIALGGEMNRRAVEEVARVNS
ncbi:MAG: flagellar hook basal-body protein [Bryobacterales bacterium]|nr:flagellar hook basal-body protein [Bryobacterales bacterium]